MGEAADVEYEPLPLLDFIPALSPRLQAPINLGRLAEAFERAQREPIAVFGTTPPQVGKTTLITHGIARWLLVQPWSRVGYVSYSARYANKRSREIKALYRRAGGTVARGDDRANEWRTGADAGGLISGGIDGAFVGESLDLVVIDDPIKGRKQAESGTERERLWDVFADTLERRFQATTSIIIIHTRWTPGDLGGRLLAGHPHPITGKPYEHIRIPALDDSGQSLHPERFSTEVFQRMRDKVVPAYSWASLFMGQPVAPGGRLFEGCNFYGGPGERALPGKLYRSLGLDMAASAKTHADFSVLVDLGFDHSKEPPDVYVLRVIRHQEPAPVFAARIRQVQQERELRSVDACWYYAGMEKGIIDFMRELGMGIDARVAALDKRIRALPVSAAWNAGRVFLPHQSEQHPWVDDLTAELAAFTGVGDQHDDQADALAAAYDAGEQSSWAVAMNRLNQDGWRR